MSETSRLFHPLEHAIDNQDVEAAYARWAPIYDLAFATLLHPGRRAAAAAASRCAGPILDVGVGTGLELPMFERRTEIVGVDLSEPMLRRAARRVEGENLSQVVGLARMDATRMAFSDAAFGCAVAPYVLTVAPEPEAMLDEIARVVRPGGDIILVNHVSKDDAPLAELGAWLGRRFASKLGWRPEFPWEIIGDWIASRKDVRLLERRALPPFGLFTMTRIERLRAIAPKRTARAPEPAAADA